MNPWTLQIRPFRKWSQHFLINPQIACRIVEVFHVEHGDWILEIGPGTGILTECLLSSLAEKIIAVEIDPRCIELLSSRFSNHPKLELVQEDFLKLDFKTFIPFSKKLRVIGNIPYAITSPILFQLLEFRAMIRDWLVTVQKEVAERIVSPSCSKVYGIPSVLFQLYGEVKILFSISKTCFSPTPKVDSSVLYGQFYEKEKYPLLDPVFFRTFLKTIFGQRRKILRNTVKKWIRHEAIFKDMDMLSKRPEALSVEELVLLANTIWKQMQSW